MDPFERGVLDRLERSPRPAPVDHLGLVEPVDRLGERIVVAVADAADGRHQVGLGQSLRVPDRDVLDAAVGVVDEIAGDGLAIVQGLLQRVEHEAGLRGVDGVVAGHIHTAEIREIAGVAYYNDGDWVEGCTALVEHFDGRMELLHWADVVAARWRVEAASRGVDAAQAAFKPSVNLSALVGLAAGNLSDLFGSDAVLGLGGPAISLPIFDGGRLSANERQAKAEFEEASAQYRSHVLKAVREVEDNLAQLRDLQQQAEDEQAAAEAAQHTQALAMNSYQAGAVSYLDVVTAQTAALQAQRTLQAVQTRQLQASVGLLTALGGGWQPG